MTISKIRTDLIQSEEFADFIKGLQEIQDSPRYNTVIASVSGTSYGDTGLSPDTNYSYFVRAVDAAK